MDNTNSVAYLKNFWGKTLALHSIARDLWLWCIKKKIHLSVAHVSGADNYQADELSRKVNDDTEWSMSEDIFRQIIEIYPTLKVDLFASRLSKKLELYVSRFPDHMAYAVDAFSFQWIAHNYYIFPPFSLITRVLQKIVQDKTEAVMVCPIWPTQPWWPSLLQIISGRCLLLPAPQKILSLPHKPNKQYPLQKMRLGVFQLSGNPSKCKEFQNRLETSSSTPGEIQLKNSMTSILKNGLITVGDHQIQLNHL